MGLSFMSPDKIDINFPRLDRSDYEITSHSTSTYNCIAWAAGESGSRPWWPRFDEQLERMGYYWPPGAPEEETVGAFIRCFEILEYEVCDSSGLEGEYEKVVIYAKDGSPTHAARQLPSGKWTSKLGADADISHDISALDGPLYGCVKVVMRRSRI